MADTTLPHFLERSMRIRARRERIFRFFTDSERWSSWLGVGSTIEPRPGGRVSIRYPNGVEAGGEVLEIEPPARLVFSFGFASGKPMPLGASRISLTLADEPGGTLLTLRHELADEAARDHHVQGWRYQLAVLANAVADAQHGAATARIDAWFAAGSEPDPSRRAEHLGDAVSAEVTFRDRFSAVEGRTDLDPHLDAIHRFMPGSRLLRSGPIRQCQGAALADWRATGADGTERGRGTNFFRFDADGLIEEVIGFWTG
ncbi:MAG: SRPBCC domain-containing protein [Betaproteobacteria bacterium]|nr:SRPBCC domain-containing protein [Betaproteobacteria bacterium]